MTDKTLKSPASINSLNSGALKGTINRAKKITGSVIPYKRELLGRISNNESLTGLIATSDENHAIRGTVDISGGVTGHLAQSQPPLIGTVLIGNEYERYEGPYTAVPTTCDQTLDTSNKVMREDVVVREIPFAEVSNPAGGTTVIIG